MKRDAKQFAFSPLVEHLIPNATINEKENAQADLYAFLEVMYRIYQRLEAEGHFPLPENGTLTKSENVQ